MPPGRKGKGRQNNEHGKGLQDRRTEQRQKGDEQARRNGFDKPRVRAAVHRRDDPEVQEGRKQHLLRDHAGEQERLPRGHQPLERQLHCRRSQQHGRQLSKNVH